MASTAEVTKKKNAAASVDKKLLQQARSETKKAKSLCVSLEKKVADLKQKANTLTKSLANSASTRKKVVEEYKTKLSQKEKKCGHCKLRIKIKLRMPQMRPLK